MQIIEILNDRQFKPAQKTEILSKMLLSGEINLEQLIAFARESKDPVKATCVEAIEYATKTNPALATPDCLDFATACLSAKAPRIKWEAARLLGNISHLFPARLDVAIKNLLINTEYPGTVVRWSAAFALRHIIKLKTVQNKDLIPAAEAIIEREEKNSIRKIYLDALKKSK